MTQTGASGGTRRVRRLAAGALGLATTALVLAACGSSGGSVKANSSGGGATATTTTTAAASGGSSITISAATVAGFGTVLVNGSGQTLYMLTTDTGGKIACTDANGCTKVWPDTELGSGQTAAQAGSGIQASLLSTEKDASGGVYVTYGGWPLYTFTGDTANGQATGEGVTDQWGTWYVLGVDGQPIKTKTGAAATTTTTAPKSGGAATTTTTAPQSGGAGF